MYQTGLSPSGNGCGVLIPIVRRTVFDITAGANSTNPVILADRIDTSKYPAGQLVIRQHSLTSSAFAASCTARFSVRNMSISLEEPQTDFVYSSDINSVDFTSADNAPSFKYCVWGQNQAGPAIRVLMTILGGATGGQVYQAYAIDLLLRWP